MYPSSFDLISEGASASSSSSVNMSNDGDGAQINRAMISLEKADLIQPHILRIGASINDRPIKLSKAVIKLNGNVVKTVTDSSVDLNLSPLLKNGRNVVEISASSTTTDATITTRLKGPNANVNSQSAGYGTSKQQLIINVQKTSCSSPRFEVHFWNEV
jgi:hypothetical protein